jgi:glycosyltransferase involved in cell wall biosynthesis
MKVTFGLRVDSNLNRGGTEVLIDHTREELRRLGVEVEILSPETRELGDILHFFGTVDSHWSAAHVALQRGVPYVCTPIFSSRVSNAGEIARRTRHRLTGRFPRLQRKLLKNARLLMPQTRREEARMRRYFGITHDRVKLVPHGVDPAFAEGDPEIFRSAHGIEGPFVLHVGAYCETKNQLNTVRAIKGTGMRLVCLGNPADPAYLEACRREADSNTLLLGPVPHEGGQLASAYAAATVLCHPSLNETFAMVAMEAAVASCRIILSNTWEAEEIYGDYARTVDPWKPEAIRAAVAAAMEEGKAPPGQSEFFLARHSWADVTRELLRNYEMVLREN